MFIDMPQRDVAMNCTHDKQDDVPGSKQKTMLDERQRRERDYHKEFANRYREKITQPVLLDVIEPGPRRPWNGYSTAYDLLMAEGLAGKRVIIPGCADSATTRSAWVS
jgi:DNA topoisomerase IB